MAMDFVGPYQIAKLQADENVARVSDSATLAASINNAIEQAASEAQGYTDAKVATRETPAGAQAKADAAEQASREYTDERVATRETPAGAQAKADAAEWESRAYTDKRVDTSHLDLDVDGTPYFKPGSMTLRVFMDTDGNPFFL